MIRLDPLEKKALKSILYDIQGDMYLFGSRTNPKKQGGDIDILIITNKINEQTLSFRIKLMSKFHLISEQKIDIIVFPTHMNESQQYFFNSLSKHKLGKRELQ
ncbi:MAG TPA: nucleotidyltransferase domain-containing protein [Candidatus Absconditabacterales bacterium]|nr:nucleotidyltransferase domain-containing protein [Candidatus Absconditabacterales bacterium]HNG97220.1 nucleotidyltransferase domain-containing protein [Candidatus Absconditabacterales bacterium]